MATSALTAGFLLSLGVAAVKCTLSLLDMPLFTVAPLPSCACSKDVWEWHASLWCSSLQCVKMSFMPGCPKALLAQTSKTDSAVWSMPGFNAPGRMPCRQESRNSTLVLDESVTFPPLNICRLLLRRITGVVPLLGSYHCCCWTRTWEHMFWVSRSVCRTDAVFEDT